MDMAANANTVQQPEEVRSSSRESSAAMVVAGEGPIETDIDEASPH